MPPSIAREFFDSIRLADDPVAAIRALANSDPPTFEDDWLECKQEPDDIRDPKQRDNKMKQMWLQALSGFANNEGGVLVWGLVARKRSKEDPTDCVTAEKPVSDPFGLKSKLNEWRRQGTDPPVGNVQIEAYEHPSGSGRGFVVCFIPEGPYKPYRTNEGDKSQFYLRTSDNFVIMSLAVLRAVFHPRTGARFWLEAELSWAFVGRDQAQRGKPILMSLEARVANRGTATAKDLLIRCEPEAAAERPHEVQMGPDWDRGTTYMRKLSPMHPGMPAERVFTWTWWVPETTRGHTVVPACHNLRFGFALYAENQEPQSFEAKFDMGELIPPRYKATVEASPREGG